MNTSKVVVTGPYGRLGSELVKLGCTPLDCDITQEDSIRDALNRLAVLPEVLVNCAAFTNVDEAENVYDNARWVNTWGLQKITNAFTKDIIHISTDYVMDGHSGPYKEDWEPEGEDHQPVNAYGWSKWGAEILANQIDRCYIVRTTGLFGGHSGKPDFVSLVRKVLGDGDYLKVTDELWSNHTYIPFLAQGILDYARYKGPKIVHLASLDIRTRYSFATIIADVFDLPRELLIPCKNKDIMGWKANRPTEGGLVVSRSFKYGSIQHYSLGGLMEMKSEES